MTSKIIVNTIEADTGISSVTFASNINLQNDSSVLVSSSGIRLGTGSTIAAPSANEITLSTNSAERLRITSAGNIGIGTDTPYTNNSFNSLSIGGSGKYGLIELVKSNGIAGSWIDAYGTNGDGNLRFTTAGTSGAITFWTGGSFTEKVRITSSGLLGIGTDNPTKALHLAQNSDIAIRMDSNNANANARTWEIVVGGNASNNAEMVFRTRQDDGTGGSECARIKRNGIIALPSGGGIDFSATSDASGMASELLDDYEEGTFTPSWGDSNSSYSSPSPTYSSQTGHYTKVGNTVYFDFYLATSNWNGSGSTMWVHGMPYAARNSGGYQQAISGNFCIQGVNDTGTINTLTGQIQPGVSLIQLYYQTSSSGNNYNTFSTGSVAETTNVTIRFNGFYFIS